MFKKILAVVAMLYAAATFAAVDVNKASAAELDGIKGIGPAISARIVDERKKGNFKDWNDFTQRVKGVGDGNAAKFSKEGLTVNGTTFSAAAAPAAKKDEKPAAPVKKDDKPAAPAVAATPAAPATPAVPAAPAAKAEKKDPKAEAKMKADEAHAKKEADKKAQAEADAKKAEEAKAKKAKAAEKPAAKDEKKAEAAKPAASAAKK